jgi:hypothetical protein
MKAMSYLNKAMLEATFLLFYKLGQNFTFGLGVAMRQKKESLILLHRIWS